MYEGQQLTNEKRNLEAIADGYQGKISKTKINSQYWLASALQKDAIQNSWDARKNKKSGRGWSIEFKIREFNNKKFLIIEDVGTTGLTGTIWKTEDELKDILQSEKEEENLAYFMSSNYSVKGPESGGKRGRGKSLFLIASEDLRFDFDSLRTDNKYVAGSIFIGEDKGAHIELEPDHAKKYIKIKMSRKLHPLKKPGTRIFIESPRSDLIEAIKKGLMLRFIERTWWEIIKKKSAYIKVDDGKKERKAKLLSWYDDKKLQENKTLKNKQFPNLSLRHKGYNIKRIMLVYDPEGEIPEGIQGISIQRKGMAVERRETNRIVHEEGMNKVYGWVEMDKKLEAAMYDLEDVEHLSFDWVRNPAKKLLDIVKIKTREFAKEVKIIENKLSKRRTVHRAIEEDIAKKINKYLNNLGFSREAIGGLKRKKHHRSLASPLRVSLSNFDTGGSKRVNFGETIQAQSTAINELNVSLPLLHRTWIVNNKGEMVAGMIREGEIHLEPKSHLEQGWPELLIEEKKFPKGDYSFRSKIIVLKDTDLEIERLGKVEKGLEFQRSISFSVEKEPDSKGLLSFEAIEDEKFTRYITARPEEDSLVIEYNTKHPYIEKLMPVEKEKEFRSFLMEIGIIVAFNQVLAEDISQEKSKLFPEISKQLKTKERNIDPSSILPVIMKKVGEFMSSQD